MGITWLKMGNKATYFSLKPDLMFIKTKTNLLHTVAKGKEPQ